MTKKFMKVFAAIALMITAATTTIVQADAHETHTSDMVSVLHYTDSTTCYITSGGACFHSRSTCSNMRSPSKTTVGKAKSYGKRACKKCWSGSYSSTTVKTVSKKTPTLESSSATIKVGSTVKIKANTDGKVTYSSRNKKIATVTKKGKVKGKKVGSTTITVKCKSSKNYKSKTLKFKVKVIRK